MILNGPYMLPLYDFPYMTINYSVYDSRPFRIWLTVYGSLIWLKYIPYMIVRIWFPYMIGYHIWLPHMSKSNHIWVHTYDHIRNHICFSTYCFLYMIIYSNHIWCGIWVSHMVLTHNHIRFPGEMYNHHSDWRNGSTALRQLH